MSNATLHEQLEQLTPENKRKAIKVFNMLREEQTQEEGGNVFLYFFDCLEPVLADRYMTACEVNELLNGIYAPIEEREIIRAAANYEATLYRYERTPAGDRINKTCLYDCEV